MIDVALRSKPRRGHWATRLRRAVSSSQLRTALALCVLLTSTLQGFVAQAHIHAPPHTATGGATLSYDGAAQPSSLPVDSDGPSKHTRGDNSSTCPLCQALAFSGAPLAHSAHAVLAPVLLRSIVAIDRVPISSISAVSYSWTGRGPPLE
jgi:hypothetical protein